MRTGILIQHAHQQRGDTDLVRGDVTGFIGVIPRRRWPSGARAGDFVDQLLKSFAEFAHTPAATLVDPVTARAVELFFLNGGEQCHVLGLCVENERDLVDEGEVERTWISLLDHLRGEENMGLLCMPLLAYVPITLGGRGEATVPQTQTLRMLLDHCREMNNRFLVIDAPQDLHEAALLRWVEELRELAGESASFGALYYPWLMNGDETLPPSGVVAGTYARVELDHKPFGVKWPPANVPLAGVTHPAVEVRWREADRLLEAHINPILSQPNRGLVAWGARTLSRDPRWIHINSRRIASVVAEQLRRDSEWVMFEIQRPELWDIIGRSVRGRLDEMWSAGLLTGPQAGLEYEVQCDAELNPPEVVNAGQVNVKVTMRPISTTEFIVVDLRLGG